MPSYPNAPPPPPGFGFGYMEALFLAVIALVTLWDVVWKLIAMWHAARRGEKVWFVILAVLNTVGILPIVYLAFVARIWSRPSESAGGGGA